MVLYLLFYYDGLNKAVFVSGSGGQFLRFERELKQIRSSVGRTRPLRLCHPLMVLEVKKLVRGALKLVNRSDTHTANPAASVHTVYT